MKERERERERERDGAIDLQGRSVIRLSCIRQTEACKLPWQPDLLLPFTLFFLSPSLFSLYTSSLSLLFINWTWGQTSDFPNLVSWRVRR